MSERKLCDKHKPICNSRPSKWFCAQSILTGFCVGGCNCNGSVIGIDGQLQFDSSTGIISVWSEGAWSALFPQPTRPFVFYCYSGAIYYVTEVGINLYQDYFCAVLGDMLFDQSTGQSYQLGDCGVWCTRCRFGGITGPTGQMGVTGPPGPTGGNNFSLVGWNTDSAGITGTTGTIILLGNNTITSLASYLATSVIIPYNSTIGDTYIKLRFASPIDVNFQLVINGALTGASVLLTAGNTTCIISGGSVIVAGDVLNVAMTLDGTLDDPTVLGIIASIQLIS